MANYTVPSQHGEQIPLQTQDRDFLSALDVVWACKYEGEMIDPTHAMELEFLFYKGAPPQWLNFYWAEHENSPWVKRDMYKELQNKITEAKRKRWSIAHVNLFHDPGSGGSTLAMQVLWDLRKELRCAKLLDSATDTKAIAQQVLRLFKAGESENQNTVLLLLDNKYTDEDPSFRINFESNILDEIKVNNITATIPVVIILTCFRQTDSLSLPESTENLKLYSSLSEEEQGNFERKQSDIIQKHGNAHSQLHAFNFMLSNFDPPYATKVCKILQPFKKESRPRTWQKLLAFLALLNSYVPGSDLPYDFCQMFFEGNQHMQPFTEFLVIFSTNEAGTRSEDKHVRIVHHKIAHECMELITKAGVKKSDTALALLRVLCRGNISMLTNTLKKLLTYRESTPTGKKNFSKLILDITTEENSEMCRRLLHEASKKFDEDPFFPQALARFYYLQIHNYKNAKTWAEEAIKRDTENSYVRDTLGQMHKHRLKSIAEKAKTIFQIGEKATKDFNEETKVAEKEMGSDMQKPGNTSTPKLFNCRGSFGYMQVADIIFNKSRKINREWSKVLTKEITLTQFFDSNEGKECQKYRSLITNLRDEVEKKFEFFEKYLHYSKPSIHKDEPNYFWTEVDKCYSNFVTQSQGNKSVLQTLKEGKASTFAGLLFTPNREVDMQLVTEQWKKLYLQSPTDINNIQNYIVANIMLSQRNDTSTALQPLEELQAMLHELWTEQEKKRSPEFYLLVLLLFWPDTQLERHNSPDISKCVKYMHDSFEETYKKYLRSRYLVPLFFHTLGHGLQRFIHISRLDETSVDLLTKLSEGAEIPELRRVRGEVGNYKVFAKEGAEEIEVSPDHPASVRGQGRVSFYLGFNIKGPVAYCIRYED